MEPTRLTHPMASEKSSCSATSTWTTLSWAHAGGGFLLSSDVLPPQCSPCWKQLEPGRSYCCREKEEEKSELWKWRWAHDQNQCLTTWTLPAAGVTTLSLPVIPHFPSPLPFLFWSWETVQASGGGCQHASPPPTPLTVTPTAGCWYN